jgi:hypothetical protein
MELDGVFYVLGLIFGWPLRWFRRWCVFRGIVSMDFSAS